MVLQQRGCILEKNENIKIIDTTQNLAEALMLFSMVRLEYGVIKD